MKHDWQQHHPLHCMQLPDEEFSASVRDSVTKTLHDTKQKGTISMKKTGKLKLTAIAAVAAAFLVTSAIGVSAATDGKLFSKVKVFINGKEQTATLVEQDENHMVYEVDVPNDGESGTALIEMTDHDEFDETEIYAEYFTEESDSADNANLAPSFYTETDENGRIWLKSTQISALSVDITDQLKESNAFDYTYLDPDNNVTYIITISGTPEEHSLNVTASSNVTTED